MRRAIHKIYGNAKTLKASDEKAIERLYRRRIPSTVVITHELCIELAVYPMKQASRSGCLSTGQGLLNM